MKDQNYFSQNIIHFLCRNDSFCTLFRTNGPIWLWPKGGPQWELRQLSSFRNSRGAWSNNKQTLIISLPNAIWKLMYRSSNMIFILSVAYGKMRYWSFCGAGELTLPALSTFVWTQGPSVCTVGVETYSCVFLFQPSLFLGVVSFLWNILQSPCLVLLKFLKELARISISTTFCPFFGCLVIQESFVCILFWGDKSWRWVILWRVIFGQCIAMLLYTGWPWFESSSWFVNSNIARFSFV